MRRVASAAVLVGIVVAAAGCGSGAGNNANSNDTGPPVKMVPNGPGAMKAPDEGGKPGVPEKLQKKK